MEARVFRTLLSMRGTKDWPWGMAKRGVLGGEAVTMAWRAVTGQRGGGRRKHWNLYSREL